MKIIFIDTENIGLSLLKTLQTSPEDKVLIYSKNQCVHAYAQQQLFFCYSNYEIGKNQADFALMAHLGRLIEQMQPTSLNPTFTLYSNDQALIQAFNQYCQQAKVSFKTIKTQEAPSTSPEQKILNALKTPHTLNPELRNQLQLTQKVFTTTVNALIKAKKIKRTSKCKRQWIRSDEGN